MSWISPPAPGRVSRQQLHDPRWQDVAADDRQVGGGLVGGGFLHHAVDPCRLPRGHGDAAAVDDAVALHMLFGDRFHHHLTVAAGAVALRHGGQVTDAVRVVDQHVGQDHGKVFIPHHGGGAEYRVAQSQRLGLAHGDDLHVVRHGVVDRRAQIMLALAGQLMFQLVVGGRSGPRSPVCHCG